MKLLIVACLLAAAAAQAGKLSEAEKKACAGDFLEGKNLTMDCENYIKNLQDELTVMILRDETVDWTISCIKDCIKRYNFFEFFLRKGLEQKPRDSAAVQLFETEAGKIVQDVCKVW